MLAASTLALSTNSSALLQAMGDVQCLLPVKNASCTSSSLRLNAQSHFVPAVMPPKLIEVVRDDLDPWVAI